jgi:hypothetical protein
VISMLHPLLRRPQVPNAHESHQPKACGIRSADRIRRPFGRGARPRQQDRVGMRSRRARCFAPARPAGAPALVTPLLARPHVGRMKQVVIPYLVSATRERASASELVFSHASRAGRLRNSGSHSPRKSLDNFSVLFIIPLPDLNQKSTQLMQEWSALKGRQAVVMSKRETRGARVCVG